MDLLPLGSDRPDGAGFNVLILHCLWPPLNAWFYGWVLRATDVVGRWDGEGFLVLLYDVTTSEQVRAIAEKLRHLVACSGLDVGAQRLAVTISVGTTLLQPEDAADSFVRRADALMYCSQQAGRDRTSVDEPQPGTSGRRAPAKRQPRLREFQLEKGADDRPTEQSWQAWLATGYAGLRCPRPLRRPRTGSDH